MCNAKMLNFYRTKKDLIFLLLTRVLTGIVTLFEILYLPVLLSISFKLFDYQRSILLNFAVLVTFGLHSGYFVLFYRLKNKTLSDEIFKSIILVVILFFFFFFLIFTLYEFQNLYSLPLTFSFLIILILEKYLVIKNKLIFSQTVKALNSVIYLVFAFFFLFDNYLFYILLTGVASLVGLFFVIKIFIPEFFNFFNFFKIRIRKKLFYVIFDLGYKQIIATFLFGVIIILLKTLFLDFYPTQYNAYSTMLNLMIMFLVLNSVLNLYFNKNFSSAANNYNNIKGFLRSHVKPLIIIYLIIYCLFTPSLMYYYNFMNFEFNNSFVVLGLFCVSFLFLIEYFNYVVVFLNKQLFYISTQIFVIIIYSSIYFLLRSDVINAKFIEIYLLLPLLIMGVLNMAYLIKKFNSNRLI